MRNFLHSHKRLLFLCLGLFGTLMLYLFLYKIYMPRVNAFGCFDDCNNFLGGYFLLHGKKLFSEIFFNHNLGMAYLSAAIQATFHPQNLYELVLRHRQFVFFFGFAMNILLLLRFGYKMLGFILLYELSKFYLFGDRFLAEGIIVYLLIYLAGIAWQKIQDKQVYFWDFVFVGLGSWVVVWMREPYIPLVLMLFCIILWGKKNWKEKGISLGIFSFLSIITLLYHNIPELIFNVFTVNAVVNIPLENQSSNIFGIGILRAFLYPLMILFTGQQTFLRTIEIPLSLLFLTFTLVGLVQRHWKILIFVLITLGFANLRYTPVGREYYDAFHQLVWYGLFIFLTIQLIAFSSVRWVMRIGILSLCGLILYTALSPQSFWHEKAHPYEEFITNYGGVLQVGQIVGILSKPSDTLFIDGYDDMIYWVSKRYSAYPYSWYTSLMPAFTKYTRARTLLLETNPPDFYYGTCAKDNNPKRLLTPSQASLYVRLLENNKLSCLWVKKTTLPHISQQQWDTAAKGYYTLPQQTQNP